MRKPGRRDFLKVAGASAAAGRALGIEPARADGAPAGKTVSDPDDSAEKYPKLSMITPYSPAKLAFAAR